MGYYTQVRGYIQVNDYNRFDFDGGEEALYENLYRNYKGKTPREELAKISTSFHYGGDGDAFIFFGGSIKNYNDDFEEWIKHLIENFYSCWGRIEFEGEAPEDRTIIWDVAEGKVRKIKYEPLI